MSKLPKDQQTCGACKFAGVASEPDDDGSTMLQCRIRPPSVGPGGYGRWPIVYPQDWCAKWEEAVTDQPATQTSGFTPPIHDQVFYDGLSALDRMEQEDE